jgi:glycosyltransferase involved in cell wall biosynthesis
VPDGAGSLADLHLRHGGAVAVEVQWRMSRALPQASGPGAPAPLVSIVVPTRNRAAMLQRAIASVAAQTFADYELIVVDDASIDDTLQQLAAQPDPRLRVIASPSPGGAPRARNRGVAAARGRFVAFLDDDDEWLPQKLERQLEVFARGPARLGLVHGGSTVVSSTTGRVVHTVVPMPGLPVQPADFLGEISFTTSVVLVRRQCLEEVGVFDEALAGSQDRDLWIRLAGACDFDAVPEVLVRRFIHGAQITTSLPAKIRAKQQIIAKYRRELRARPRELSQHLWRLGILQCVAGDRVAGRRALLGSIAARPWQRSAWRDLLTSFAPGDRCRAALTARRLDSVDGVLLYY